MEKYNEKKRRGRPKEKKGKRVTFFLSFDCIKKLNDMTTISRNKSKFIETLINEKFEKINQIKE